MEKYAKIERVKNQGMGWVLPFIDAFFCVGECKPRPRYVPRIRGKATGEKNRHFPVVCRKPAFSAKMGVYSRGVYGI